MIWSCRAPSPDLIAVNASSQHGRDLDAVGPQVRHLAVEGHLDVALLTV
jgi:hypothetical protein